MATDNDNNKYFDEYDTYDDFDLNGGGGGGGGGTGGGSRVKKRNETRGGGAGSGSIYSAKHTRMREGVKNANQPRIKEGSGKSKGNK